MCSRPPAPVALNCCADQEVEDLLSGDALDEASAGFWQECTGHSCGACCSPVQGMAFLRPSTVGVKTHRQGYWEGVKLSVRVYLLVVVLLFVAAVNEAVSVIFIIM